MTLDGTAYTTTGTNSAQTYTADDYNLTGADITFTTAAGVVTFADGGADGSIDLADAADLTINSTGGNIIINVPILGTDGGVSTDVVLNAVAGNVTIEDIGTNDDINDVTITGTTINTDGTIKTAVVSAGDATAGNVLLTGAVNLSGNTTINTATGGGTVGVVGTIDGAKTLTITSGAGNVDISGIIGGSTAIGNTAINDSAGAGTIDLFGIGDGDPAAGIDGTLDIGNTNTALVDFDGTNYDVSGNVTVESKTCLLYTSPSPRD